MAWLQRQDIKNGVITGNHIDASTAWDFTSVGVKADVIAESTSAAGVTVDGLLLKDGFIVALDNQGWKLGTGLDDYCIHDGTKTKWTHNTGNLEINNANVTGATLMTLGTDTSAVKFAVQNDSAVDLFSVTPASATAGTVAVVGTLTTTDGVTSGVARAVGGRADVDTANGTAHTNSTDEAVLTSYSIPANTIKAGTVVKVKFCARVSADNGATTLTGRLRLGATTLTGTALITTSATDTGVDSLFMGEFTLIGRAAPGAAAAVVGMGWFCEPAAAGGAALTANLGSTNFATNGALLLELTADWSAADANSIRSEIWEVEIIG